MLKFSSYDVVMQEIPNEISLGFSIVGCKLACKGCHSSYLWDENSGNELTDEILIQLLSKYGGNVSCVLFMGGEWEKDLLNKLKIVKELGIKTALYTGLSEKKVPPELLTHLDYIKYGRWVEKLGGLKSPFTNQKLINLNTGENLNKYFTDPHY